MNDNASAVQVGTSVFTARSLAIAPDGAFSYCPGPFVKLGITRLYGTQVLISTYLPLSIYLCRQGHLTLRSGDRKTQYMLFAQRALFDVYVYLADLRDYR
jgi:hypothetical protein